VARLAEDAMIDLKSAMPRFNNDLAFYIEMVEEFYTNLLERVLELKAALASSDAPLVHRLGHNLKGVAANFGAGELVAPAAGLEIKGRQNDLSGAQELVEQIETQVPKLGAFLEDLKRAA
jgi:HPt (histidine-containing phosphotransfer) domain-containing protein